MVTRVLTVCLCPRPNVCAERELTLVGRRQPCVQAFSRMVPVWRPGCGRRDWCVGHKRRCVQGSPGPVGGGGCSHAAQHGPFRQRGGRAVRVSGHRCRPRPVTEAPHLRSRPLTPPLGCGRHGGYSQTVSACSAATWGPGGWGRTPWGGGLGGEGGDSMGQEGTLQGEVLTTQQGEKRGAQPAEVLAGGGCYSLTPSPCEAFIARDFISQSNRGVPLPISLLSVDSGSGVCLVAKLGGVR